MRLGERFDLAGLRGGPFCEPQGAPDDLEGIADVLQFTGKLVPMTVQEVLQAPQQVRREVRAVPRRIAMRADRVQTCDNECIARPLPLTRLRRLSTGAIAADTVWLACSNTWLRARFGGATCNRRVRLASSFPTYSMVTDRRSFIVSGSAFSVAAFLPAGFAEETSSTEAAKPPEGEVARNRGPLPKDLVFAFVRAGHRDLPRVKEMLQSVPALLNASWDWGGGDWETALGGASHVGNHEIARYLLERGANIDAFCAAMLGEYQLLASLLTANPSAATASGPHRLTLLYHVAISGNVAIASLLKPLLAPRARDYDQALSAAGRGGHLEMTRWLLANGVTDPNQPDGVGKTALAHAVEKGFKQVADELRRYGAQ